MSDDAPIKDINEERRNRANRNKNAKAIGSINWEALQHGHGQSFDEATGVYTGAEEFVKKKNEDIEKAVATRIKRREEL